MTHLLTTCRLCEEVLFSIFRRINIRLLIRMKRERKRNQETNIILKEQNKDSGRDAYLSYAFTHVVNKVIHNFIRQQTCLWGKIDHLCCNGV
jgi:hypothetical protein